MSAPSGAREPAGASAHRARGAAVRARCAVVTVSDTRSSATDESGDRCARLLEEGGHQVVQRRIVPNDAGRIAEALREVAAGGAADVVLFLGGTGVSRRDRTVTAVRPLIERELPGFGELFRMLSYQEQIGSAAMLSRSVAGVMGAMLIAVLPGSPAAVELAVGRLLLPELGHILSEMRKE